MKRKVLTLLSVLIIAIGICGGCGVKNTSENTNKQVATQDPTLPPNINPDKELARVSTLSQFFKARSITLNEKVLRFPLNDTQMKYVGFTLSENNTIPQTIAVGETVENICYTTSDGLTAYVSATNTLNTNTEYNRCQYNYLKLIKGDCQNVALHLPNKLTWDTKADTIKTEYGEPQQETQNENGNTVLSYSDSSKTEKYLLELVLDESGIIEVTIQFSKV